MQQQGHGAASPPCTILGFLVPDRKGRAGWEKSHPKAQFVAASTDFASP